jgi:hypothetical protein
MDTPVSLPEDAPSKTVLMDEISTPIRNTLSKDPMAETLYVRPMQDLLETIVPSLDQQTIHINDLLVESSDDELLTTTFVFSTETMYSSNLLIPIENLLPPKDDQHVVELNHCRPLIALKMFENEEQPSL